MYMCRLVRMYKYTCVYMHVHSMYGMYIEKSKLYVDKTL